MYACERSFSHLKNIKTNLKLAPEVTLIVGIITLFKRINLEAYVAASILQLKVLTVTMISFPSSLIILIFSGI